MITAWAPASFIRSPDAIPIHPAKTAGTRNAMIAEESDSFQEVDYVSIQNNFKPAHPMGKMSRLFAATLIQWPKFQHIGLARLQR